MFNHSKNGRKTGTSRRKSDFTQVGDAVLDTNKWYKLDVSCPSAAAEVRVWIDDQLELSATRSASTDNIVLAFLGGAGSPSNFQTFHDNILYDDTAISSPLPSGKIIARQGKAGTPTYDEWTKTSSQSIDAVWSETPFSGTNNAVSPGKWRPSPPVDARLQLQRSPIGPCSETIANGDTINGSIVGQVAQRSSGAGRTLEILKRLNSTDTFTTVTFSSANTDFYKASGVFTDTLANLNAAEIGGRKSGGAAGRTYTIQDTWLMCDFAPTAAPGEATLTQRAAIFENDNGTTPDTNTLTASGSPALTVEKASALPCASRWMRQLRPRPRSFICSTTTTTGRGRRRRRARLPYLSEFRALTAMRLPAARPGVPARSTPAAGRRIRPHLAALK